MPRPFIQATYQDLSRLVEENSTNNEVLIKLIDEMGFRRRTANRIAVIREKAELYIKRNSDNVGPNSSSQNEAEEDSELTDDDEDFFLEDPLDKREIGDEMQDSEFSQNSAKIEEKLQRENNMLIRTASPNLTNVPSVYMGSEGSSFPIQGLEGANNTLQKYIAVLDGLVKEIRRFRRFAKTVTLTGGRKQPEVSGEHGYLYSFPYDSDEEFFEGTSVELIAGQTEVKGTIVSLLKEQKTLLISLVHDLGETITHCSITQDEAAFYEALADRLRVENNPEGDEGRPPVGMNIPMADNVISGKSKAIADQDLITLMDTGLNADQTDFINKANKQSVSFLWGPPGTGKTQTLGALIGSFYNADQKTLICSNTNQAVDQVLLKLCRQLKSEGRVSDLDEGRIIRIGQIHQSELLEEFKDYVTIDGIVDRLSSDLKEQIAKKVSKKAKCQRQLNSIIRILELDQKLQEAKSNQDAIDRNERLLKKAEKEKTAYQMRFLKFLGKSLSSIEGDIRKFTNEKNRLEKAFPNLEKEISKLSNELKDKDVQDAREKSELLGAEINDINEEIKALEQEIEELSKKILANAKVLGSTLTKSFLSPDLLGKFKNVVIDEASMALLPSLYFTASQSEIRVIISGDFRQLPPIIKSRNRNILDILENDIFSVSGTEEKFEKLIESSNLGILRSQYRMDPKICDLISEIGYSGELKTAQDRVVSNLESPENFEASVILVDTSDFMPFAEPDLYNSTFNTTHALIARNIIRTFISDRRFGSIGYCANFRAQVKVVKKMIEADDPDKNVSVGTVHTFQGDERNTIIFDTVNSYGSNILSIPLQHELPSKSNLITVAVSRAQHRLIIIGNYEFLDKKIPAQGYLRKLLNKAETNGKIVNANKIIDIAQLEAFEAQPNINIPQLQKNIRSLGQTLLRGEDFYPSFFSAVESARRYICIYSGFYTSRRVASVLPKLKQAIDRGIKVRVVITPPKDNAAINDKAESLGIINKLEEAGIVVDLRMKIHQKMVLIDEDTFFFGSLNPLSFGGATQETTLRLEGNNLCGTMHEVHAIKRDLAKDEVALMVEKENPNCDACGGLTSLGIKAATRKPYAKCISCDGWGTVL